MSSDLRVERSALSTALLVVEGREASSFWKLREWLDPKSFSSVSLPNIFDPRSPEPSFEGATAEQKAALVYLIISYLVSLRNERGRLDGEPIEEARKNLLNLFKKASFGIELSQEEKGLQLIYQQLSQANRWLHDVIHGLRDQEERPLYVAALFSFSHEALDWYAKTAGIATFAWGRLRQCFESRKREAPNLELESFLSELAGRVSQSVCSPEENVLVFNVVMSVMAVWEQGRAECPAYFGIRRGLAEDFLKGNRETINKFKEEIRIKKYDLTWLSPLVEYVSQFPQDFVQDSPKPVLGKRPQRPEALTSPRAGREFNTPFIRPRDFPFRIEISPEMRQRFLELSPEDDELSSSGSSFSSEDSRRDKRPALDDEESPASETDEQPIVLDLSLPVQLPLMEDPASVMDPALYSPDYEWLRLARQRKSP